MFANSNVFELVPGNCSRLGSCPLARQAQAAAVSRQPQQPQPVDRSTPCETAQPDVEVVRPLANVRLEDVLRQLARQYRLPLRALRAWNAHLPRRLTKGRRYTVRLVAPPRPNPWYGYRG